MEAGVGLGSRLAALQNNNDWKVLHAFLWLWWILEASKLTTLVVFEQMKTLIYLGYLDKSNIFWIVKI